FHTIVSIKNDGHYFCRAGGNRPDGLNEPVTYKQLLIKDNNNGTFLKTANNASLVNTAPDRHRICCY
ncbi:hypothetical protein CUT87_23460, partial [Salmonella enterica subsp. enterica serovar Typhimurium]